MKRNLMLVQNAVAGSIQRCCQGVVHVHILRNGLSLRFTEEAFLGFASMVEEAHSQLINEGLSDLIDDAQRKEKE